MEEKIFLKVEESRKRYWHLYLIIILFIALFAYVYLQISQSSYVLLILVPSLIIAIALEIARLGNILYVMESGVRKEEGVFNKKYIDIDYVDILRIVAKKTVIQRVLNYGDLEFDASGMGDAAVEIRNISNPLFVKAKIEDMMDSIKGKESVKKK
ncbi:MAG: PH domain-containing protein [archaeon]